MPSTQSRDDKRRITDAERQLVGSLVGSYSFKASGLVKKTMSVKVEDATYHLVSYYHVEDVMGGHLHTPQTKSLHHVRPRPQLLSMHNFRQVSPDNKYNEQLHTYHLPDLYPPVVIGLAATPQYPSSFSFRSPQCFFCGGSNEIVV